MRGLAGAALIVLAAACLSGCSSDYVMATKDGRMIMTEGKPSIDKETGLVEYTDQTGHAVQINSDEVSTIIER
ncbi:YgdI/YgdR family lipoprotein [Pantoea sp. NSTU24]|uniref:YgdI/YgdR family lipoprotein n=1 Tax=Pantoea sp. NSTU24 TaxID=3391144 RepID=UPI003D001C66